MSLKTNNKISKELPKNVTIGNPLNLENNS